MVEGIYYGRGDKTRTRLSDVEVVRLHRQREDTEDAADRLLADYISRDPVPDARRAQAHLFVVASPVTPRREMLLDAVHGDTWQETFHRLADAGRRLGIGPEFDRERFAPDLTRAGSFGRRSDGAALTDSGLTASRELAEPPVHGAPPREDAFELWLSEDGVIRLMNTRLSDQPLNTAEQMLLVETIPILTRRVLRIAVAVADHTGYQGSWVLGFAATRIAGAGVWADRAWDSPPGRVPQDQDEYRATTTASRFEMAELPGAVTSRLVGRLLRTIGQAEAMAVYTTDR